MAYALHDEDLCRALQAWKLDEPMSVSRISGGLSAEVWRVDSGQHRYIAKFAFDDQKAFESGLRVAEIVQQAGIASGCPLRTSDGALTNFLEGPPGKYHPLALLAYVPGEPLDLLDKSSQKRAGTALGQLLKTLQPHKEVLHDPDRLLGYITEESEEVNQYPWLRSKAVFTGECADWKVQRRYHSSNRSLQTCVNTILAERARC